jgi:hypothetical protein
VNCQQARTATKTVLRQETALESQRQYMTIIFIPGPDGYFEITEFM